MAYIGTNNMILQFRQNVEDVINKALKDGIPPTVIKLVLENYGYLNDELVKNLIAKEDEQYRTQLLEEQKESQVEGDINE